jgi:hypothetical protein
MSKDLDGCVCKSIVQEMDGSPENGRLVVGFIWHYVCRDTNMRTQILFKDVPRLNAVLCEEAVTVCLVGHVVVEMRIVTPVHYNTPLVGITDAVLGNHRPGNVAAHMKMNWLSQEETMLTKCGVRGRVTWEWGVGAREC